MRLNVFVLTLLLSIHASAAAPCPAGVAAFAPEVLRRDGKLQSVCEPFRFDGRDFIAVAFSNGGGGRVAVVKEHPQLCVVARAPEMLFDVAQSIELHDFDRDGHDELVVKFSSRNDVLWWIYAFDPTAGLRLVSPDGDAEPPIANGELVDVDGDRKTDVLSASVVRESTDGDTVAYPRFDLYSWDRGALRVAPQGTIAHYSVHLRGKAEPVNDVVDVHVLKPGRYRIKLLNGVLPETSMCSSGEVLLNGKPVFAADDFKKHSAVNTAEVDLQFDNVVEVRLGSTPGCAVILIVDNPQDAR